MLKKVLKYAPKAVEVAEAVNGDSAIIKTDIVKEGNDFTYTKNFDYSPENIQAPSYGETAFEEPETETKSSGGQAPDISASNMGKTETAEADEHIPDALF